MTLECVDWWNMFKTYVRGHLHGGRFATFIGWSSDDYCCHGLKSRHEPSVLGFSTTYSTTPIRKVGTRHGNWMLLSGQWETPMRKQQKKLALVYSSWLAQWISENRHQKPWSLPLKIGFSYRCSVRKNRDWWNLKPFFLFCGERLTLW